MVPVPGSWSSSRTAPSPAHSRSARGSPSVSASRSCSFSTASPPSRRTTGSTSAAQPCIGGPSGRSSHRSRNPAASAGSPAAKARPASPLYFARETASASGTSIMVNEATGPSVWPGPNGRPGRTARTDGPGGQPGRTARTDRLPRARAAARHGTSPRPRRPCRRGPGTARPAPHGAGCSHRGPSQATGSGTGRSAGFPCFGAFAVTITPATTPASSITPAATQMATV